MPKETLSDYEKYQNNSRVKVRNKAIKMYGGACVCCGEKEPEFLSIDLKRDYAHRKPFAGKAVYEDAAQKKRPEKYEILCYNCSSAIWRFGTCPHQK